MTEFEIKHGLSQDAPGPLEPVEIAQQDDTLARTGNTARDQEMYAAGIEVGEANTKHNAAIRAGAGWLPIESAPKTGCTLLLGYWNSHGKWRTVRGKWMSLEYIAEHWEDPDDAEEGWFETAVEADDVPNCWPVSPSHWQPMPAPPCPTCNDQGAVGNILTAQPCPDCAAPGVSTAEDAQDDSIALDKLADYIADNWPDKKYGLEEICQRLNATWPGAFMPVAPAAGDALDAARYRLAVADCILVLRGDAALGRDEWDSKLDALAKTQGAK